MSTPRDHWDPADGPPPTDDERDDARVLAAALELPASASLKKASERDLEPLVTAALRARATAHPNANDVRAIAAAAVEHALVVADQRWYRRSWPWVAAAAGVVLAVAGTQLAIVRPASDDASGAISHPATDVFVAALDGELRSGPIGRIADTRMRAYRDGLLHARTRRAP